MICFEQNYFKNEILEGYVNMIYYGYGVYGIEVVFCLYFGKYVKDLNDVEVVFLVGILKGLFGYLFYISEKKVKQCQKIIF